MSLNVVILGLRVLGAVLLYAFLSAAIWVIWCEGQTTAHQVAQQRQVAAQPLGRLVVVQPGGSDLAVGETWSLDAVSRIGRAASNTVSIQDAFASAEHAQLSFRSGRWWLEDLGSRNGTLLNEERLTAPTIVATGDVIGIGEVRLRIEI